MTESEINALVARIIVSTRRKKRQYSIYEVAEDISLLKKHMGGMNKVSELVGVSPGMLSQFLSVFKLPAQIIELVQLRKIDKVSLVHYLTKFNSQDAITLANLILNDDLSSQDLRILIPYRKQFPNSAINDLVKKIHTSKDIKVSVIRISKINFNKTRNDIKNILSNIIGVENLIAIDFIDERIDLKISKLGEKILREKANMEKKSLQEFITQLLM